jgi:hypothetical protein
MGVALIVICAGTANDALENQESLECAWAQQADGDGKAATALLNELGIPIADHNRLIEDALQRATALVNALRPAIISLGELVIRKGIARDKQIKRRYNKHK